MKPFVWFALTVQTSFLWNYFLRIILENFMDMLFTNLLRLYREPYTPNWRESMTTIVAILLTLSMTLFLVVTTIFVCLKSKKVNSDEF